MWKVILILTMLSVTLFMASCSSTKAQMPDWAYISRLRFLSPETLDSVTYRDGNFSIEGYKSEQAQIIEAAIRAVLGSRVWEGPQQNAVPSTVQNHGHWHHPVTGESNYHHIH